MHEQIVALLRDVDSYAAAQHIQKSGTPADIAEQYESLVMELYWSSRDLPAAVTIGRMGLLFCLTHPHHGTGLIESARRLAYNVGSFCWPGWNEPGITITAAEQAAGREAARVHLRLATQLHKPPLVQSIAHWLVGAHALAERDRVPAEMAFDQALTLAQQAGSEAHVLANEAYRALPGHLAGESAATEQFSSAIAKLDARSDNESREFARQLQVAAIVFATPPKRKRATSRRRA